MIKELNHIGLFTSDMAASKEFYGDVLGGSVIRDYADAKGSLYVYIQIALGVIELIRVPEDMENKGFIHVAYLIDATKTLEEDHAYLAGKGYKFTVEPKSTAAGDGRLAFFIDHSGVSFELIQREENIRVRDLVNPRIEAFHHIAVNVSPKAAIECDAFYLQDMGFQKTGSGRYTIGADTIELTETEDRTALEKPLSHICLKVKDCCETAAYLKSRGVMCSEISPCGQGSRFEVIGPGKERVVFIS